MDKVAEQSIWVEKYRPQTVEDCILPDRLKIPFQKYVDEKDIPNLLLTGSPGVGKTTIAKAMCEQIGCDYMFLNGSDERGIDVIRYKVASYASTMSLSGGRKVIIIDEADNLTSQAQDILRAAIEEYSSNCSFIFTGNFKSKIKSPIISRFVNVEFNLKPEEKAKMASQFFKRVQNILHEEKVEFDDKVVSEVVKKHFPDFRRILNELQGYSKFGKIDVGILAQFSNTRIEEAIKFLKEKDFTSLRKWVGSNSIDPASFFRQVYDALYDFMEPKSIPQAVIILADYQHKSSFCYDQELNTMACLTEIMVNCEFK